MSAAQEEPLSSRERELERKLREAERSVRQLLRDRERAENFTLRSKQGILATTRELQESVRQLETAMADLSLAKVKAERANEAKGRCVATISHELRTPMNGILGTAELLAAAELDPGQRELVTIIERSATGLLSIISDVLDFSKAEGGCIEIERVRFDLHAVLGAVSDLQLNVARAKSLNLEFALAAQVPRFVVGDPVRLRQVLLNLLGNALKFSDLARATLS